MDEQPKLTLEELATLIVGRIVEPWNLPTFPLEEPNVIFSHNRVMWTLKFIIDEQKRYKVELEVRRIGKNDSLALAQRLQAEFEILEFRMDSYDASFTLGIKNTHDIAAEEEEEERENLTIIV